MPTDNELQRLAAMANALRPEWPTKSLLTHLAKNHADRPYRDLAVALAWIATDLQTLTPARLAEAGPWWKATSVDSPTVTHVPPRCGLHPDQPAARCRECDEASKSTDHQAGAALVRAELAKHRRRPPTRHPEPEQHDLTGARARADQEKP